MSKSAKSFAPNSRDLRRLSPDYSLRERYHGLLKRCYSKRHKNYCLYGARGIQVCDEWRYSFAAFRDWAYANGWDPSLQIDRIDCDGHYSPDNCRWVTSRENNRNRRNNKLDVEKVAEIRRLMMEGFSGPEVARMFGVHHSLIYRIKLNQQWL